MTDRAAWRPHIDQAACTGCGDCIVNCPTSALGWRNDKARLVNPNACLYGAACEDICPVGAITLPFLITRVQQKNEDMNE